MAPGLDKASDLIFVMVSIAGVEVVALVDTGATTSCCRWEWYQKWKDHLGAVIKSKVRIIGVGPDPIKIKGLTRPLTLHWNGVGGKFQLMILTALTDVDVVLGMDVLSQFDVKIDFKKQVASPAREPCTPLEPAKTVGLLLNNPGFTFKGKIPVKEEGVEEVAKGVPRQAYREVHRVWMVSERKMKTKDKRKDRRIVWESSMPWDKAGYKAQLQRDFKDIQHKLSRVLGKNLDKSDNSFVEVTSPVKCIEGGVLVDLCMQRPGKRGSGCDVPKSADRAPKLSKEFSKSSEGLPTPETSPLRPPKPPRTEVRQYSWRNSTRKEVCMHIRMLKPKEIRKEKEELTFKSQESTNCPFLSDVIVASSNSDDTLQDVEVNTLIARKRYVPRKRSLMHSEGSFKSSLGVCSQTLTLIALILSIIISVVGGLFNIKLPERKSIVGTPSEPLIRIRFRSSSILYILRESSVTIVGINGELCSCINKGMFLNNSKQLIRCMKILQTTIRYEETFCSQNLKCSSKLARPLITTRSHGYSILSYVTLAQNVFPPKRSGTYIFPSADFCAFQVYYLDTYTINLELDDNFKVFYDPVYLYIFTFYRSWSSCNWATYSSDIFHTLVYFSLNWIVSVIRSHDKYQSLILIGLALTGKASSGIQCILFHLRSYWREWRPLVTPWAVLYKRRH